MVAPQLILAWTLWGFGAFLIYLFLSGLIWGAGYSPTSKAQLRAAATLLQLKRGDTVYDLGSGFGRALIFFAKEQDVSAIGAEIDPVRKFITLWSARRERVSTRVIVLRKNLLDVDLRSANKVFFFLSPLLMRRLQEKLGREMAPGSLVVSVEHRFPEWKPAQTIGDVFLYAVPPAPQLGAEQGLYAK